MADGKRDVYVNQHLSAGPVGAAVTYVLGSDTNPASSTMSRSRRYQLLTDQAVQGELLFRAIIYWFFCLLVVALLVLAWSFFSGAPRPLPVVVRQSLSAAAPALFSSVILLPVVLLDVLKVSSRFVGPIQQVRHTLRQLSQGQPARPGVLGLPRGSHRGGCTA